MERDAIINTLSFTLFNRLKKKDSFIIVRSFITIRSCARHGFREKVMLKKTLSIAMMVMLFGFSTQVFAQNKNEKEVGIVFGDHAGTVVSRQVDLARGLVDFGYKNNSSISLVLAAEIFSQYAVVPLVLTDTLGKPIETEAPEHSYEPNKLLQDAKYFAKGDAELLAYVEKVKTELSKQTKGETMVAASTAVVRLSGKQSKTISFSIDPLCVYKVEASSSTVVGMDVTTKPGFLLKMAGAQDEHKGYSEGCYPSRVFGVLAYNEVCVTINNLNSSSTDVEVVLTKMFCGEDAAQWLENNQ